MAKGSVRKKGRKWYYRFYVEDESGNLVQRERVGTESKSETEKLLRMAMAEYENGKSETKKENITLENLLDLWVDEELKPGRLSNGTVMIYQSVVSRIKQHPIGQRKLRGITAEHLQAFFDLLAFGGTRQNGLQTEPLGQSSILQYSAVLRSAFRFAVFPKRFIAFDPMQYVIHHGKKEQLNLFYKDAPKEHSISVITHEQYNKVTQYLAKQDNPALLPIQIAYFTGLRLGEICGLIWQDVNLTEQYLTVCRSVGYNSFRHSLEIGATKRNKIRIVDFSNTLADILEKAKQTQAQQQAVCGRMYQKNYYKKITEKGREYYELHTFDNMQTIPDEYKELSFVCIRQDGTIESPATISSVCRAISKHIDGMNGFHFHMLRHTYTSNLLSAGANIKDVQELLGHSDINTTMNIYAHATREAKRTSVKLLDKVLE